MTLEQKAVSSAPGSAQLAFHIQAELRSIVHGAAPPGGSEEVSLVTLDDCMDRFRWQDIELIKIDAEGEEANIVKGGRRFFANLAPLVQYEMKSATDRELRPNPRLRGNRLRFVPLVAGSQLAGSV